ncbi:MAG: tRNA-modifying protein YgfZ [Shewanella sp.]|nr:tRNA-modifying protein YgfZ [Shewanella sp.]MCF1430780.1 tRNA-modifying protein YgfZ [Shewanella sp.]MCF1437526.1 tRNA-modifying protein YgfZ [Shewanella sp.]MCF1457919.1 tRNA-modifying protein YgfZ [Shewanella sp.]
MTAALQSPDWAPGTGFPPLVISPLSHLGLIRINGEQTRQFMQGQVTSDIDKQSKDEWHWGAHCDPKGKMLASFRSLFDGDDLLLLMPRSAITVDLPQLQKYAVFNKVELTDASDTLAILGIAGEQASRFVTDHIGPDDAAVTALDEALVMRDRERFIIITSAAKAEALMALAPETVFDHSAWQQLEILAGYPNLPAAHANQFVPQMCNLQAVNGISFNKGCYMGQETVARMKYRGGNKRALYIASGTVNDLVDADSQLEIQLEDGSFRRAGTVLEVAQTGDKVLLSAVLPNDTELSARLRLAGDDASELKLLPLPYSLED